MAKKVTISKEKLEYTISHFNTKADASAYLGISVPTYRKLLKENSLIFSATQEVVNGKTVRRIIRPDIDKQWFVDNWINTDKSLSDLSKENDVPLSVLEYRASSLGLCKQFKYKLDADRLMDISCVEACYLAGLIATDGYVNTNANFVSLTMVGESEKELLGDILRFFGSSDTVREYKGPKPIYNIRIPCKGYKEFLLKEFGIPAEGKTKHVSIPSSFANENCAKAYVLGCFDGDGWTTHTKGGSPSMGLLTQSEEFVYGVADIIEKYTGVHVCRGCGRGYPEIRIGKISSVTKVLKWMYSSKSSLRLGRKYLKVKDIVCSME